jgi:hypothetical protein
LSIKSIYIAGNPWRSAEPLTGTAPAAARAFWHTGAVRGFVFCAAARNLSQVV